MCDQVCKNRSCQCTKIVVFFKFVSRYSCAEQNTIFYHNADNLLKFTECKSSFQN